MILRLGLIGEAPRLPRARLPAARPPWDRPTLLIVDATTRVQAPQMLLSLEGRLRAAGVDASRLEEPGPRPGAAAVYLGSEPEFALQRRPTLLVLLGAMGPSAGWRRSVLPLAGLADLRLERCTPGLLEALVRPLAAGVGVRGR
ncbi:MAG: hypothetical protein OEY14_16280 [Myxococcales bacterium]|nr:hypothetical protein [Myxococcales bacterium]